MKVEWSPRAMQRAREIADFIAQDNVEAARFWLFELFSKTEQLEKSPQSGRMVPEFNRPGLRELFHGKYRIIYRVYKQQVKILTVWHSRRVLPPKEVRSPKA